MKNLLINGLNNIMNAKRAGKKSCIVPASKFLISVLNILKKEEYIKEYKILKEETFEKISIEFGKLNECRAITPRFNVTGKEIDKYVRRFLPARDFGIIIISSSKGLITHKEALEENIGGSLIAYCY